MKLNTPRFPRPYYPSASNIIVKLILLTVIASFFGCSSMNNKAPQATNETPTRKQDSDGYGSSAPRSKAKPVMKQDIESNKIPQVTSKPKTKIEAKAKTSTSQARQTTEQKKAVKAIKKKPDVAKVTPPPTKKKLQKTKKTGIAKPSPKAKPIETPKIIKPEVDKPFELANLNSLPIMIGANWTLDRALNQAERRHCFIAYKPLEMGDGQGLTPTHLTINQDNIVLKTKSNIDTSYPNSGLTIDANPQIPIEELFNTSSIVYQDHYTIAIKQLIEGSQATFSLGFWPTWPVTQTYSVAYDVTEFAEAYKSLERCLHLEQQLK